MPANQWVGSLHGITQEPFLQRPPGAKQARKAGAVSHGGFAIFPYSQNPVIVRLTLARLYLPKTVILRLDALDFC